MRKNSVITHALANGYVIIIYEVFIVIKILEHQGGGIN